MAKKERERLIRAISLFLVLGFLTFVVSLMISLGAKGLDVADIFDQFLFYFATAAVFLPLLMLGILLEILITKGDKKYGDFLLFSSPGGIAKGFTQLQLAWLSTLIIVPLGVLAVTKNFTFAGLVSLEQQFTPVSQLLFSISLIPGSENIGFALIITLTMILLRVFARKVKMTKANFKILFPILVIFNGALYWFINHQLRYSGQDLNLLIVLMFGVVMAILTLATKSFIPAWILHIVNNFFYDAKTIFASDLVVTYTLVVITLLAFGYGYVYRGRLFGDKSKRKK